MREPECHKCGERRRLFVVEPGRWLCKGQGNCDHRCEVRDARVRRLVADLDALDRIDAQLAADEHAVELREGELFRPDWLVVTCGCGARFSVSPSASPVQITLALAALHSCRASF